MQDSASQDRGRIAGQEAKCDAESGMEQGRSDRRLGSSRHARDQEAGGYRSASMRNMLRGRGFSCYRSIRCSSERSCSNIDPEEVIRGAYARAYLINELRDDIASSSWGGRDE